MFGYGDLLHEVQLLCRNGVETGVVGESQKGRRIPYIFVGKKNGNRMIVQGAIHAREHLTALLLVDMAKYLVKNSPKMLGGIYFVPMVNPDGVDLVTGATEPGTLPYAAARQIAENFPAIPFPNGWKANLLGVDPNLQYPARWLLAREIKFRQGFDRPAPRDYVGRAPLSQRESIAMAELTEEVNPELVLAYHTQGKVIYWQFQDYQVPGARELAEEFSRISGYELEDVPYESSFAGYKDWFIQSFRRPGFTIECGLGESPLPLSQFEEIYQANLGILVTAALGLPKS